MEIARTWRKSLGFKSYNEDSFEGTQRQWRRRFGHQSKGFRLECTFVCNLVQTARDRQYPAPKILHKHFRSGVAGPVPCKQQDIYLQRRTASNGNNEQGLLTVSLNLETTNCNARTTGKPADITPKLYCNEKIWTRQSYFVVTNVPFLLLFSKSRRVGLDSAIGLWLRRYFGFRRCSCTEAVRALFILNNRNSVSPRVGKFPSESRQKNIYQLDGWRPAADASK